ncbi:MAG: cyclic nucleotide-binding domain-containing protein [Proteobacteria bacterium]|nr:cyclic nucleotide-binding domain-containing protein [Pseudomonadota bacterium]
MARNIKILNREFFPAGTLILEQGTTGNRAFVIESGKVEVFAQDSHGTPVIIAELGPEAMFGEMAVVADGTRKASVRTKEDTVLITIHAHEFRQSMQTSESFFKNVMRLSKERMQDMGMKLLKKERKLAMIEKTAPLTLKNVSLNVAQGGQVQVKQEMLTVDKKFFPAGTIVIEQGTVGTNAFLIESGRVQVFKKDASGQEAVLSELGAKALIGEMGALSNKPRRASVRTIEDSVLIPISAAELQVVMGISEDLHKTLVGMIVNRLKDTHQKLFGKDTDGLK